MRWYCPGCWRDFGEDLARCPHCGLDIQGFWSSKDYVEKLILALRHPEPTTPVRAAEVLGRLQAGQAVEPLMELVRANSDVFIVRSAIRALAAIGNSAALQFLETLTQSAAEWIRREAAAALDSAVSKDMTAPRNGDPR